MTEVAEQFDKAHAEAERAAVRMREANARMRATGARMTKSAPGPRPTG